jgi:hypothetical protein
VFTPTRATQKFCSRRCCRAATARRDYWNHVEQRRAAARAERQRDRDKWRAYQRDYRARNLDRHRAYEAEWRQKNTDRHFDSRLQREYGITLADYNRILAEQGGGCGICGVREARSKGRGSRLHVDHDHVNRQVRGLLCDTCNRGIGQLGDDPKRVRAAARYLERTRNSEATRTNVFPDHWIPVTEEMLEDLKALHGVH